MIYEISLYLTCIALITVQHLNFQYKSNSLNKSKNLFVIYSSFVMFFALMFCVFVFIENSKLKGTL